MAVANSPVYRVASRDAAVRGLQLVVIQNVEQPLS
jgi:hypothetical protein